MAAQRLALLVGAVTLVIASVAPASAEFFGCNEPRTRVSYSSPRAYSGHYAQATRQQRTYQTSQNHRRMASQWR